MANPEAPTTAAPAAAATLDAVQERVLDVVRGLARELGGSRALQAAAPGASLERDVGLGSLERVELLVRLESAFGRAFDDGLLRADTPAELARLILSADAASEPLRVAGRAAAVGEAAPPEAAATIHESLWRRAQAEPERPHVFVREDDGREHTVTYGGLLERARLVAGGLQERGVRAGDAVALMLPTGADFLAAFQGTLLAGAVAVPIYPPVRLDRLEEYARRQAAILADAGAVALITAARAAPVAALLRSAVPGLADVATVAELAAAGASWPAPPGAGADPAFIQYTSGSTGSPKGVLLTHDNLLANIRAIAAGVQLAPTDVGASWLPLYHDMGLIGTWLFCLHHGIPLDLQSPLAFLARPERWLWAIHRRGATLSAAPNFAYELCLRRVPDAALEGLDLSSWRCALNGAEPVSADTLERFARRFARYGFRREALLPVYGLAESSVALCFPPLDRGPRVDRVRRAPFTAEGLARPAPAGDGNALQFVSAGPPLPGHEVRIVDAAGRDVPERVVGRLAFRGPSMTSGYFRQPEATAAVTLPGGWMDSGDLAYQADGEIFVTGRVKDLIIKAGRNLVPQEIEEAAAGVEGIRRGCVVAVGLSDAALGTESLVVVAETRARERAERDRLVAAVTERVVGTVGVPPDVVCLVPPGAVPKTSSGKIRRAETRSLYAAGKLGRPAGLGARMRLRLAAAAAAGAARPALRAMGRGLFAVYYGGALLALGLPVWLLAAVVPRGRALQALQRAAAVLVLRLAGCRLSAEGTEHLGGSRPYFLACNHTSYSDVPTLVALVPRDFAFVAKPEVLRYPVAGTFLRRARHLTVDRWEAQQSVADAGQLARRVRDGQSVLVFPEGTFTAHVGLRPFRLGVFKAAVESGTPVVPLALQGARRVMRGDWWLPRPGALRLWVGAPIAPEGDGWPAVLALRDRVAAAIAAHCGEPVLDLVAAGPQRPAPGAPA